MSIIDRIIVFLSNLLSRGPVAIENEPETPAVNGATPAAVEPEASEDPDPVDPASVAPEVVPAAAPDLDFPEVAEEAVLDESDIETAADSLIEIGGGTEIVDS